MDRNRSPFTMAGVVLIAVLVTAVDGYWRPGTAGESSVSKGAIPAAPKRQSLERCGGDRRAILQQATEHVRQNVVTPLDQHYSNEKMLMNVLPGCQLRIEGHVRLSSDTADYGEIGFAFEMERDADEDRWVAGELIFDEENKEKLTAARTEETLQGHVVATALLDHYRFGAMCDSAGNFNRFFNFDDFAAHLAKLETVKRLEDRRSVIGLLFHGHAAGKDDNNFEATCTLVALMTVARIKELYETYGIDMDNPKILPPLKTVMGMNELLQIIPSIRQIEPRP